MGKGVNSASMGDTSPDYSLVPTHFLPIREVLKYRNI